MAWFIKMIQYKKPEEIELIRAAAQIVSRTLGLVAEYIAPGVTTERLDQLAEEFIRDNGGVPAFKGFKAKSSTPFPGSLCTSVNDEIVHGIPGEYALKEGDIISVDCGVKKDGYFGDHAYTFAVGDVEPDTLRLLKATKESLYRGIEQMKAGNRLGDIGYAIQSCVEAEGFTVVRELVGHGLGKRMHEEPHVPNHGKRGKGKKMKNGLVLAVEPMINQGSREVRQLSDDWTIVTKDGLPSAHFEHDIAIVDGKPEILSTFDFVEEALRKKAMPII